MSRVAMQGESFEIQRRGDIVIVEPSPEVESMSDAMIEQAAQLVLAPLKNSPVPPSGIIFDLSRVNYFGSLFITFLLRCHFALPQPDVALQFGLEAKRIQACIAFFDVSE